MTERQAGHAYVRAGRNGLAIKRCMDVIVSAAVIVAMWPILGLVALLVRWKLGTPVIFRQLRPGLNGAPFTMYKFRTMTDSRRDNGTLLEDASRITGLGRFLRSSSLDELPELVNVFKGEMSLVGPRPLLMQYLGLYNQEQMRRHDMLPGITGWAQVNGRNALSWTEKFALDTWYIDNWSLWLDLRILERTIVNVARRRGINQAGHATMEEFRGDIAQQT